MGRVVPWVSWAEWEQVAAWLWSARSVDVSKGTDRVAAWRARGRVPVGADITATLLEISHQDSVWSSAVSGTGQMFQSSFRADGPRALYAQQFTVCLVPGLHNEHSIRLAYSMAIVRLVNGIVDSGQKGQSASSVAHLATTFGLPRLLVDIRHEATHNNLPSIAVLRLASRSALSWLHDHYWEGQRQYLANNQNRIQTTLSNFLEIHRQSWLRARSDEETMPTSEAESGAGTLKQQRKVVLSALKDSVPAAATHLLADPLLQVLQDQTRAERTAHSSVGGKRSKDASGLPWDWDEALSALSQEWPLLPGVALSTAIEHGCEAFRAGGYSASISYAALTQQLLETGPLSTRSGAKKSRKRSSLSGQAGQEDTLRRSGQQLPALISRILLGCNEVWAEWQNTRANGDQEEAIQVWLRTALELAEALPAGKQQDRALFLARHMVSVISLESEMLPTHWQERGPSREEPSCGKPKQKAKATVTKSKPWSKAEKWSPCAIGCLPSGSNPNGIVPTLVNMSVEVYTQPEHGSQELKDAAGMMSSGVDEEDAVAWYGVASKQQQQEVDEHQHVLPDTDEEAVSADGLSSPAIASCRSVDLWRLSQGGASKALLVPLM